MKCVSFLVCVFGITGCINTNSLESTNKSGWIQASASSKIYYLLGELPMNYLDAYEFCDLQGGILGEPRSANQTKDINAMINTENNYWLGLNYSRLRGVFLWNSDGHGIEEYHHWAANQPSGDGDCVHLYARATADERWNDQPCGTTHIDNHPILALCQKTI